MAFAKAVADKISAVFNTTAIMFSAFSGVVLFFLAATSNDEGNLCFTTFPIFGLGRSHRFRLISAHQVTMNSFHRPPIVVHVFREPE